MRLKSIYFSVQCALLLLLCGNHVLAGQRKVSIGLPGPCYELTEMKENSVYFKSKGACDNTINLAPVDIDDQYKDVLVYIDGNLYKKQPVSSLSMEAVRTIAGRAQNNAQDLTAPENKHAAYGQMAADNVVSSFQSPEYQEKLKQETERLKSVLFNLNSGAEEVLEANDEVSQGNQGRVFSQNERVYIFISKSVPKETLRAYVADINKLGDTNVVMVMRGFVGGMQLFKPTQKFIADLINSDPDCDYLNKKCAMLSANIMVDPLLFRKYRIDRVPSVVYASNVTVKDPSLSEGKSENVEVNNYYQLSGDVSLSYALKTFYKETQNSSLKFAQNKLEAGFYEKIPKEGE